MVLSSYGGGSSYVCIVLGQLRKCMHSFTWVRACTSISTSICKTAFRSSAKICDEKGHRIRPRSSTRPTCPGRGSVLLLLFLSNGWRQVLSDATLRYLARIEETGGLADLQYRLSCLTPPHRGDNTCCSVIFWIQTHR